MYKQKITGKVTNSQRLQREISKYRLHSSDESRIIEKFFISLDTPVSLSCYLLFKYQEFDQLVSKEVNALSYNDAYDFRDDFAAVSFLRKNQFLRTSFDKKAAALSSFLEAESNCKDVNNHLRDLASGRITSVRGEQLLDRVARKIQIILGDFDIDYVLERCSWGPGVTLTVKGDDTSGSRKFDVDCDITADAYDLYGPCLLLAYPGWDNLASLHRSVGNTIITVPKNAKTDRTIAIEPGLNTWIQLGIGKLIRERLRCAGFNLNSDLRNQRGAYKGSLDDSLATVDFKGASDSISYELVKRILPSTWFVALDAARSHYYMLNGHTHRSEKFSTMGNGFTFELESLIFVTIALVVNKELGNNLSEISIFGDDLIIPGNSMQQVTECSQFFGFTINRTKSYSNGYFRESCGSFYFNGVDVKPLFLKTRISRLKDVYRIANSISTLAHARNCNHGRDIKFRSLWSLIVHQVPEDLRLFGPVSSGDSTIHSNRSESRTCKPAKDKWEGFLYHGLPEVPIDVEKESLGLLLSRLSRTSKDSALKNFVSLRARTRIVLKKSMFVHLWYELGSWF